jgi:anaerobic selenocysteine-containing dehydrogenase
MANMAWNSTMNTMEVRKMLNARDEDGEYKIPFLVVCDAFQSEMVAFADLVLPDTTYLERHDVMSMLDRPISEFDGPVDSVRVPVVEPTGNCKPFQEVLIELASRLKFPAFTREDGTRKFKDYPDFIVNFQAQPGVGFLMGWRGKDGTEHLRGDPNPRQWEMYAKNNCVFQYHMPEDQQYMRNWNQPYLDFAKDKGWRQRNDPVQLAIYSDTLQAFRLAAQGKTKGRQPPEHLRERIATYFDPLPFWYAPLETACTDADRYPLAAITQRPMAMYHSWDSQNAWLRQIHSHNYLHVNPRTAQEAGMSRRRLGLGDQRLGRAALHAALQRCGGAGHGLDLERDRQGPGAWHLAPAADESRKGFLLNHLITEELPFAGGRISNSDPVTGQAGWYDVRVNLRPAAPEEPAGNLPPASGRQPCRAPQACSAGARKVAAYLVPRKP